MISVFLFSFLLSFKIVGRNVCQISTEKERGGRRCISGGRRTATDKAHIYISGKILTKKNINFNAMRNVLASLQWPNKGMEVHDLGDTDIVLCFIMFWI